MNKKLSENDLVLLTKIRKLDECGYTRWPEISHLANQLEDKDEREWKMEEESKLRQLAMSREEWLEYKQQQEKQEV